jgi:hypothetical protein
MTNQQVNSVETLVEGLQTFIKVQTKTYRQLAELVDVSEDAIKSFVARQPRGLRATNGTVNALVKFICDNYDEIVEETPQIHAILAAIVDSELATKMLSQEAQITRAYRQIYEMLNQNSEKFPEDVESILDKFTCFRAGAVENRVVRSRLDISFRRNASVLQYSHLTHDKDANKISADGPALVFGDYVYLIGDVLNGGSLEFIVVERPVVSDAKFVSAFAITTASNRQVIMARLLLRRGWPSETDELRPISTKEFQDSDHDASRILNTISNSQNKVVANTFQSLFIKNTE